MVKKEGSEVIGGAINGESSIRVKVTKTGKDSFLSQVVELVREAQESKSRTQDLANRAAVWLSVTALLGGAMTFFVWMVLMGRGAAFALERMVTVMVITCPHALGLAVPLVVAVSTAISAKNGLLIRDRASFERARNIQTVVFDKTGTLTEGRFGVSNVIVCGEGITEQELLKYAGMVEARSEHPTANGIATAAADHPEVEKFRAITGRGAEGKVNGKRILIVNPGYLRENGIEVADGWRVEGNDCSGRHNKRGVEGGSLLPQSYGSEMHNAYWRQRKGS